MPLQPEIDGHISVPAVWIHLAEALQPEDTRRKVTYRIKQEGGRSITHSATVDLYSPESSILRAYEDATEQLTAYQGKLYPDLVKSVCQAALEKWVAPF